MNVDYEPAMNMLKANKGILSPKPSVYDVNFTCVALVKEGLVVGPLSPSFHLSVCNTLGCLVCVICNSKSFNSNIV